MPGTLGGRSKTIEARGTGVMPGSPLVKDVQLGGRGSVHGEKDW